MNFFHFKEKRKNLEVQVHRISLIERREEQLKEDLKEKSGHVAQLAERIAVSHIEGLVQDCGNSSALAMELPWSCAKPSM